MKKFDVDLSKIEQEPAEVEFKEGDQVKAQVYKFTDLGATVIINDKYLGLIYQNDIYRNLEIGEKLTAYIKKIREDNKIDVTLRKTGYDRIKDAKTKILACLEKQNGFLALTDNSSPAQIKKKLAISKGSFKTAIGSLYKEKLIEITEKGIKLRN
jgi:hypothetical protein